MFWFAILRKTSLLALCIAFAIAYASAQDYSYKISTTQPWTDTGLDLHAGDTLKISAEGSSSAAGSCTPDGDASAGSQAANLPVPAGLPGALIARLEENGSAQLVGKSQQLRVGEPGHLFFGINANSPPSCQGSFAVKVHLSSDEVAAAETAKGAAENLAAKSAASTPATATTAAQPAATASGQSQTASGNEVKDVKGALYSAAQTWLSGQFGTTGAAASTPGTTSSSATPSAAAANAAPAPSLPALTISSTPLDAKLRKDIDGLPRRVNDQLKNQGDMVNFVIVGSQKKMQDALTAANWRVADRDVKESVMKAVLETYQKKAYMQMPMSDLYLYERVQDFGYEQGEAYAVVASRHHFRIWKAPFQWDGQDVWVGAGTHDIGFEKDQRNGNVTHKIDPAVDGERDNIGSSLQTSGQAKSLTYYLPPNPVQEAKNATGGGYHSDGRILVIVLN